jgi:hypothetical protein
MPIEDFLLPINRGKQAWQVLRSNLTRGDHPYNFLGICQALVSQWFLEVRFAAGKQPDELGRYLLNGDLGQAGYGGLAKAQAAKLSLDVQSGGTLHRDTGIFGSGGIPLPDGATCTKVVLTFAHGIDMRAINSLEEIDQAIEENINGDPSVFCAQLSLSGVNSRWFSWAIGATWGHAIGIHCNGDSLYVFDPNYGTFIIDPKNQVDVTGFFQDLWGRYAPTVGSLDEVTVTAQ